MKLVSDPLIKIMGSRLMNEKNVVRQRLIITESVNTLYQYHVYQKKNLVSIQFHLTLVNQKNETLNNSIPLHPQSKQGLIRGMNNERRDEEPERERMVMVANVGEEVIRELSSGVEVGEVSKDGGPSEFLGIGRRRGRVRVVVVVVGVEVKGVFEGSYGFGEVAAELLQLLMNRDGCGSGVFGIGRRRRRKRSFGSMVGPHEDLLHRVLLCVCVGAA